MSSVSGITLGALYTELLPFDGKFLDIANVKFAMAYCIPFTVFTNIWTYLILRENIIKMK